MTHTTEKLEAMLAAATPGPWICYADIPSADPNWHIVTTANKLRVLANVHIEPGNSVDPANAALIAAAPTITAELIAARRKLDAVQGLVETVEAYKSASKSEMVIPADRGGQWGPKGSAIAKTLERKGEMFAALAAWEVAQ